MSMIHLSTIADCSTLTRSTLTPRINDERKHLGDIPEVSAAKAGPRRSLGRIDEFDLATFVVGTESQDICDQAVGAGRIVQRIAETRPNPMVRFAPAGRTVR